MEGVQELQNELAAAPRRPGELRIQSGVYFLELSSDWIVLRASENIHHLLGESHVTLIDEPLGRFVQGQALHDLRNLFSRLSGTTGVARAYGVRLTHERDLVDVSFQLSESRVLLEAVPCAERRFGEAFGTVGGLIAGLSRDSGQALLDGGARRMRALTGYDRVTVFTGTERAESSRGAFPNAAAPGTELPVIVADCDGAGEGVFPRRTDDSTLARALTRAPDGEAADQLRSEGVRACLTVPFTGDGFSGYFRCDSKRVRSPSFELHAAAELFAQFFAMRLENDRLKSG
jgi:light-regulated signal transduction histidine kinase (bacteriophytochrome)